MHNTFQRPLVIGERLMLGFDCVSPPFMIQLVVEGHGDLDINQLSLAVAEASRANPGSRLVLKGMLRRAYWQDSGITPPVKKVSGTLWGGYDPANAPFLNERLPYHGPTCDVVLLEGPQPRVVFRANHAVMDGHGVMTWAEDVFRVLRGEEPLGAYSTESEAQVAAKITDKTRTMPPADSIAPSGKACRAPSGIRWRRLSFEGTYAKLVGRIGWVLAQQAWSHGDGPVRLLIPVDLRGRQPVLRSTGNLSIGIYVDVTRDSTPDSIAHDTWRQLFKKHDCMLFEGGTSLDCMPIPIVGLGLKLVTRMQQRKGRYGFSAAISHFGRTEISLLNCAGFTADTVFIVPPRLELAPAGVMIIECPDRTEIILTMPNALATGGRFEQIVQAISQAVQ